MELTAKKLGIVATTLIAVLIALLVIVNTIRGEQPKTAPAITVSSDSVDSPKLQVMQGDAPAPNDTQTNASNPNANAPVDAKPFK